tara:strand:- start:237 stop:422 length:186 start_codon:yes stop_codon:yes gene_type:complete
MINCVSSSNADPNAISKNLAKSFSEFLDAPSAIFEGIETADLVICELNPYLSVLGKVSTKV